MAADLIYNFNENSATTIRDYSENGNDGTGTNMTVASSSRVGNDGVFNATNEQVRMGNITLLNGAANCSFHIGIQIDSGGAGTKKILEKSGQVSIVYNYTTGNLETSLTVAGGTNTVSDAVSTGTFIDYDVKYNGANLAVFIDGSAGDTDNTFTGVIASNANVMYIGDTGATDSAFFLLNELNIFSSFITGPQALAMINEQNGVYSDSGLDANFALGDIIATDVFETPKYAIVTWVGTNSEFRFVPITSNITTAKIFRRVGHLWDTARQWSMTINDDEICWYNGVSLSTEAFTTAKEVICIDKDGLRKNSITKTANYTATSYDQRIYVDSSGGAFTITLEASPVTDREIEIIDSTGNCQAFNITVAGNGNNIIGSANYVIATDYEGLRLIFNGSNWNLN